MIKTIVLIALIAVVAAQSSGMGETGGDQPTKSRTKADVEKFQQAAQAVNGATSPTDVIFPGIFSEFEMKKDDNSIYYTHVRFDSFDFDAQYHFLNVLVCPTYGTGTADKAKFYNSLNGNWETATAKKVGQADCFEKQYDLSSAQTGEITKVSNEYSTSNLGVATKITVSARVVDSNNNDYSPALILSTTTVKYEIPANTYKNFRVFTDQPITNFVIGVSNKLTMKIQAYMYTEPVSATTSTETLQKNVGWKVDDVAVKAGQICTGNVMDIKGVEEDQLMYLGVKSVEKEVDGVTVTYKDVLDCSSASSVSALVAVVAVITKLFF